MEFKKKYNSLIVDRHQITPYESTVNTLTKLPSGAYSLMSMPMGDSWWFEKLNINSDDILDLPSPEYTKVVKDMRLFIDPNTKEKFKALNFIYKRSVLLHGMPGTGKTVIVNKVAKDIISSGGICLYAKDPYLLQKALEALECLQPDCLIGVILEEFDELIDNFEDTFLQLLDGQVQKSNIIYLATTNYIDKIPKRIYRPGRFASVIEVGFPNAEARKVYLKHKLGNFKDLSLWVKKTAGLSIDELKEVVQATYILEEPLDDVISRIINVKGEKYSPDKVLEDKRFLDREEYEGN